jgi:hypothetical protein
MKIKMQQLDPVKIRRLGLEAVEKRLGPTDMIHFLRHFESGSGDYTKEREKWLKDASVTSVVEDITKRRTAKR